MNTPFTRGFLLGVLLRFAVFYSRDKPSMQIQVPESQAGIIGWLAQYGPPGAQIKRMKYRARPVIRWTLSGPQLADFVQWINDYLSPEIDPAFHARFTDWSSRWYPHL